MSATVDQRSVWGTLDTKGAEHNVTTALLPAKGTDMNRAMGRALVVVIGVASAFIGPRLLQKGDAPGGAPFAFEPPAEFKHLPDKSGVVDPNTWVHAPSAAMASFPPRFSLSHTKGAGSVEAADLSRLATGMPDVFRASGISWTLDKVQTRERSDGARFGIIEGSATKKSARDAPDLGVSYVVRQFVFPDDSGTSIVTASYPRDEMSKWEATFDAAALSATGVARRAPAVPATTFLMWGAGGSVLAALLVMAANGKKRTSSHEAT